MKRTVLTEEQWQTICTFLVRHPRVYVGPPDICRRFLNAVLWVLRSGAQSQGQRATAGTKSPLAYARTAAD